MAMSGAERQALWRARRAKMVERLQKQVKNLQGQARSLSRNDNYGHGYSAPFPPVVDIAGSRDIGSRRIREWFEDRVCAGELSPAMLALVALDLNDLAMIYGGRGRGDRDKRPKLTDAEAQKRRETVQRQRAKRRGTLP